MAEKKWHPWHMSASDVAEHNLAARSGRKYASEQDVLNVKENVEIIGLLQLILKEIRGLKKESPELEMREHRHFLMWVHRRIMKLLEDHRKERERVLSLIKDVPIGSCDDLSEYSIGQFSYWYRKNYEHFCESRKSLKRKIMRLKSVKKVDDLINLKGIGKATMAKIKKAV